ncbi:unnamed protein product [Brassica napus]|uniref:(rape) hypothetical protein n=1 Tax=Brassica napus TaxID=3708 RepID=A0A816L604_BRANA|nr:unnamed protein product [Brassica napus]
MLIPVFQANANGVVVSSLILFRNFSIASRMLLKNFSALLNPELISIR